MVPLRQINHKAGKFACSHSPGLSIFSGGDSKNTSRVPLLCCVEIYVQFLGERPFFATAFCPNPDGKMLLRITRVQSLAQKRAIKQLEGHSPAVRDFIYEYLMYVCARRLGLNIVSESAVRGLFSGVAVMGWN